MDSRGGDLDLSWPDRGEWNRWRDALAAAAERLHAERGIDDPWRLTVGWGSLWAEYGDRRLAVSGAASEQLRPEDLFDEIDTWVAFSRMAGPGRVLDRDRRAMAEWRERLPGVRQFWEDVARSVFRDVAATTDLNLPWKVVVHEDGPDWRAFRARFAGGGAVGGIVATETPIPRPERRPLDFPEIWIEMPHTGRSLPEMDDEAEALGHLADLVQEDVIEEIHGAWPPCPRHPHPLEVGYTDSGRATWGCPTDPDIEFPIGRLAGD